MNLSEQHPDALKYYAEFGVDARNDEYQILQLLSDNNQTMSSGNNSIGT